SRARTVAPPCFPRKERFPMALAHAIAEHLPYLRRYARALCGTQMSGDAYVRACLQAVVADPAVLDARLPPRVGLYRLYQHTLTSSDLQPTAVPDSAGTVEKRLGPPTRVSRQALQLTAMEGVSSSSTGHILGVSDEQQIKQMVSDAVGAI